VSRLGLMAALLCVGALVVRAGPAGAQGASTREGGARLAAPPPRAPTPVASEEGGAGLSAPPPSVRPVAPPEADMDDPDAALEGWQGPRVELGYVRYRIGDGHGGGVVHGAQFGGYLPTGPARLGLHGELAGRDYSLGRSTDMLVRGTVVAGYQHVGRGWPVVPYVAVVGTGGVLFGKRFATAMTNTLWGAGFEIGADAPLKAPLWVGASFAWIRLTMDNLRYDLWVLRIRMGL
jgi:hypothetical protein